MSNKKESAHENSTDEERKKVPKTRFSKRNDKKKTAPLGLPPPLPEFMRDNAAACAVPGTSNTGGQARSSGRCGAPNPDLDDCNKSQISDLTRRKRPRHGGCSLPEWSNCPAHGLSFVPDVVPQRHFERAVRMLPAGLAVLRSKAWAARVGIFMVVPFARGHRFGPYTMSTANHNGIHEASQQDTMAVHCQSRLIARPMDFLFFPRGCPSATLSAQSRCCHQDSLCCAPGLGLRELAFSWWCPLLEVIASGLTPCPRRTTMASAKPLSNQYPRRHYPKAM
ncbi:uncharacterized protein [Dermacentor andersoni]|uniref:uncharacterized protein isoform X2 n=1 Tax=Dermacentor andersoni TaxID=34620 RepID=UPI0024175E11|nr:uncharacterized protein LOC126543591 isoform X2 [Dermacentor andersoni]